MIGMYGPIFFHSGSTGLATFDEMKKTVTARWGEHAVHLSMPLLEYTGPQLAEVTFKMELIAPWTVDPLGTLLTLEGIMDSAMPLPLIVGMKPMGRGMSLFVLTSLSHEQKYFYRNGGLLGASVEVQLKEYPATFNVSSLTQALGGIGIGGGGLGAGLTIGPGGITASATIGPISASLGIGPGGITGGVGLNMNNLGLGNIGSDASAGQLPSSLTSTEQAANAATNNVVSPQIAQNSGNPVPSNMGFGAPPPSAPANPPQISDAEVVTQGD